MKRLNYTKLEVTLLKTPVCLQNSSPMNPPHVLGIPVDVNPPCPRNSSQRNPPFPFGIPRCRPWYGYGYFLEPPIHITTPELIEVQPTVLLKVSYHPLVRCNSHFSRQDLGLERRDTCFERCDAHVKRRDTGLMRHSENCKFQGLIFSGDISNPLLNETSVREKFVMRHHQ